MDGGIFAYSLDLPAPGVSAKVGFALTVKVSNKGMLPSDEVAQVYMDWLQLFGTKAADSFEGRFKAAYRQLVGFRRVSLFPGETKKMKFFVSPEQLTVWSFESKAASPLCPANTRNGTRCGSPVPASGMARLSVGGQQPLQATSVPSNVVIAMVSVTDQ